VSAFRLFIYLFFYKCCRYVYTAKPDKRTLRSRRHRLHARQQDSSPTTDDDAPDDDAAPAPIHCDEICTLRNEQVEKHEKLLADRQQQDS
jgi:hypothetical protein